MAKPYPEQIFCRHNLNKGSIDIQAKMVPVEEESEDSPLEIHRAGLSRFVLTIKNKGEFVTANIPAQDVAGITEASRVAMLLRADRKMNPKETFNPLVLGKLREKLAVGEIIDETDLDELEGKSAPEEPKEVDRASDVFTLTIPLCGRKTAYELIKTEGITRAENQEKFIRSKAGENPSFTTNNLRQADALKEAIRMFHEGNLESGSAAVIDTKKPYQVYLKGPKPRMSKKDASGNSQVYNISIGCYLDNDKYPWEVKIDSWFGRVEKQPNGSLRVGERVGETVSKSFFLSDEDWAEAIRVMEKTLDHFENMVFKEMFEMANKYAWKPNTEE